MTIDGKALGDLVERLEKAEGGSRELDAEIALLEGWTLQKMKGDRQPYWRKPGVTHWFSREHDGPPMYTTSIDAAVALAERLLPRWSGVVDFGRDAPMRRADIYSHVKEMGEDEYGEPVEIRDFSWGEARTPALALTAAVLRALATQVTEERA